MTAIVTVTPSSFFRTIKLVEEKAFGVGTKHVLYKEIRKHVTSSQFLSLYGSRTSDYYKFNFILWSSLNSTFIYVRPKREGKLNISCAENEVRHE